MRSLSSRRKRLAYVVGLAVLAVVVLLRLVSPPLIDNIGLALFDTYQRFEPREQADLPIRIVDIDDESLTRIGQWPWPRTKVAELLHRIAGHGAAVIALDVVFAEPDRTSPGEVIASLRRLGVADGLPSAEALPDNDDVLAAAFAELPIAAGMILTPQKKPVLPPVKPGFAYGGDSPLTYLPALGGAISNLPLLDAAAPGLGFFSFQADHDLIIRRVPLVARAGDNLYPSLSIEALRIAQGATSVLVRSTGASGESAYGDGGAMAAVKTGHFEIPTNGVGELWVYYSGQMRQRMVPAWQVLEAPENDAGMRALFDGHIVFLGTGAPGLRDLVATPLGSSTPGVLVHAEAVGQVLSGTYLWRPDWASGLEFLAMIVSGAVLVLLLPQIGAAWCAVIGATLIAANVGGSWYAFAAHRFLLDPVYPVLGTALVYLGVTGSLFLTVERERRFVREAFSRYLAPQLVDRLADSPDQLTLGGEDREITVLFSDIRGFTSISEGLSPQELTRLLNNYLTPMTDTLLGRGATIDKYIGDAIMAFWNAPLTIDDHARTGVEAALEMLRRLKVLNQAGGLQASADKARTLSIGIGINTGTCCVGNLGSEQRFSYSALGDAVNLASRIEGLTKQYKLPILIGERTADLAGELALAEIDRIRVVGKAQPARIFALLGDAALAGSPEFAAWRQAHGAALAAYRSRRWHEALNLVDAAQASLPADGTDVDMSGFYDVYRERIRGFEQSPPDAAWDGVFEAREK